MNDKKGKEETNAKIRKIKRKWMNDQEKLEMNERVRRKMRKRMKE